MLDKALAEGQLEGWHYELLGGREYIGHIRRGIFAGSHIAATPTGIKEKIKMSLTKENFRNRIEIGMLDVPGEEIEKIIRSDNPDRLSIEVREILNFITGSDALIILIEPKPLSAKTDEFDYRNYLNNLARLSKKKHTITVEQKKASDLILAITFTMHDRYSELIGEIDNAEIYVKNNLIELNKTAKKFKNVGFFCCSAYGGEEKNEKGELIPMVPPEPYGIVDPLRFILGRLR